MSVYIYIYTHIYIYIYKYSKLNTRTLNCDHCQKSLFFVPKQVVTAALAWCIAHPSSGHPLPVWCIFGSMEFQKLKHLHSSKWSSVCVCCVLTFKSRKPWYYREEADMAEEDNVSNTEDAWTSFRYHNGNFFGRPCETMWEIPSGELT